MQAIFMIAVVASLVNAPVFADALTSLAPIVPKEPIYTSLSGDRLRWAVEGQQVMITTTFRSYLEEETNCICIIEVRDEAGITVFLAWQSGKIKPLGNHTIGVSWLAQEPAGYYQSRVFAFEDFETYNVLSNVYNSKIEVR